jgi:hypothetical protein
MPTATPDQLEALTTEQQKDAVVDNKAVDARTDEILKEISS